MKQLTHRTNKNVKKSKFNQSHLSLNKNKSNSNAKNISLKKNPKSQHTPKQNQNRQILLNKKIKLFDKKYLQKAKRSINFDQMLQDIYYKITTYCNQQVPLKQVQRMKINDFKFYNINNKQLQKKLNQKDLKKLKAATIIQKFWRSIVTKKICQKYSQLLQNFQLVQQKKSDFQLQNDYKKIKEDFNCQSFSSDTVTKLIDTNSWEQYKMHMMKQINQKQTSNKKKQSPKQSKLTGPQTYQENEYTQYNQQSKVYSQHEQDAFKQGWKKIIEMSLQYLPKVQSKSKMILDYIIKKSKQNLQNLEISKVNSFIQKQIIQQRNLNTKIKKHSMTQKSLQLIETKYSYFLKQGKDHFKVSQDFQHQKYDSLCQRKYILKGLKAIKQTIVACKRDSNRIRNLQKQNIYIYESCSTENINVNLKTEESLNELYDNTPRINTSSQLQTIIFSKSQNLQTVSQIQQSIYQFLLHQIVKQIFLSTFLTKLQHKFNMIKIPLTKLSFKQIQQFLKKIQENINQKTIQLINQQMIPTPAELLSLMRMNNDNFQVEDGFYELVFSTNIFIKCRDIFLSTKKDLIIFQKSIYVFRKQYITQQIKVKIRERQELISKKMNRLKKYIREIQSNYLKAIFDSLNQQIINFKTIPQPNIFIYPVPLNNILTNKNFTVNSVKQGDQFIKKAIDQVIQNIKVQNKNDQGYNALLAQLSFMQNNWNSFGDQYLQICLQIVDTVQQYLFQQIIKDFVF